ncbi:MAG TPA: amidophosphoribosyltransferase [Alphaproteobacteria bacterium]|nr:amidophosphoribosyltransferase [Alphaproteobacteria bacterium]
MPWWNAVINLILPPRCIKCGKILGERNGLCSDCFNKIRFISAPYCAHCGRPFTDESGLSTGKKQLCGKCLQEKRPLFALQRSAFIYDDESKNLILDFKFCDKTGSAETLANLLFSAGHDIWNEKPDLLIPVPIHKLRLLKRRYNQSALLVKYLALKTGIKADYFSLIRQQNTIPQVQLSGKARRHNLHKAFCAALPQNLQGKSAVLVDDVETTGSTLNECAKVLKKAGVTKIYALTLARTEV